MLLAGSTGSGIAEVKARPEFVRLPVTVQNRVIYLVSGPGDTRELTAVFSYNSVLSIPVVLDQLVPRLEALPPPG